MTLTLNLYDAMVFTIMLMCVSVPLLILLVGELDNIRKSRMRWYR